MKTRLLATFLCLCGTSCLGTARAQIETTGPVTFGADGMIVLSDIDLKADGIRVGSAIRAADCLLYLRTASDLDVAGGTVAIVIDTIDRLVFSGGVADLKKNLYLTGGITGENDRSTFSTSSAATISKTVSLPAGHTVETGLGLTLTAGAGQAAVTVSRAHLPATRRDKEGIARRYEFSAPISASSVSFHCLRGDIAPMTNPQLYYRHQTKQSWDQIYESGPAGVDCVSGAGFAAAVGLTVFDAAEIYCPAYFTPNGDGINDLYEIENGHKYPDSRLVIMTRRGKVVYDQSPYRNDFDGGDLKEDTYYFVFYKSSTDKKPQKWAVDIYR